MNPKPSLSALSPAAAAAASAAQRPAAARDAESRGGFAELLQAQARSAEAAAHGGVYANGSAFDVPAARPEPARAPAAPAPRAARSENTGTPPAANAPRPPVHAAAHGASHGSRPSAPPPAAQAEAERARLRRQSTDAARAESRRGEQAPREAKGADERGEARGADDETKTPSDATAGATAVAADARPEAPASAPVLDWLARFGRGAAGDATSDADALDALGGAGAAAGRGARELRGLPGRDGAEAPGATVDTSDATALAREPAASFGTTEFALPAEAHADRGADPGHASPGAAGPVDAALSTAAAAATPGTSPTGVASAPVEVQLPTPPTSPDFPAALALRLTTLATEGVQQASLQLNPADMGPIAVQIVVDGSQAQIDFGAAHAQTREALAASLPALAASLHAAGLTLTGGGVSDQRPGAQDGTPACRGEGGLRGPGEEGTDAALAGAAALPRAAQRGLLDLYA